MLWCFLGKIGDRNHQKQRYILLLGLSWWRWWCPLGAGGQALGAVLSFCGVFPAFRPLSRFALGVLLANMALFRVFRGFLARFVWVCVGLCCLRALRGLWGFCARESLGGLKACGVFAHRFISLPLFLSFFVPLLLVLLSSACPLSLWVVGGFLLFGLLFLFPLRTTIQKERAQSVFLRPLSVYCRPVISL